MAIIRSFSGVAGGGIHVDNRIGITKVPGKDANINNDRIISGDGKESFKKVFGDCLNQSGGDICSLRNS